MYVIFVFQFVGVEGLVTSFVDTFPSLRQKGRKDIFVAIACIVQFLIGLSMVTNVSIYVFNMADIYMKLYIHIYIYIYIITYMHVYTFVYQC